MYIYIYVQRIYLYNFESRDLAHNCAFENSNRYLYCIVHNALLYDYDRYYVFITFLVQMKKIISS